MFFAKKQLAAMKIFPWKMYERKALKFLDNFQVAKGGFAGWGLNFVLLMLK